MAHGLKPLQIHHSGEHADVLWIFLPVENQSTWFGFGQQGLLLLSVELSPPSDVRILLLTGLKP